MAGDTKSIRSILEDMNNGKIHLPDFQRPYVWEVGKALSFLNSLYRKYPAGSFLFWETTLEQKIGNEVEEKEYNFLVDGQQRLTSLLYIIYNRLPWGSEFRGKKPTYKVYFNPFSEEFKTSRTGGTDPNHWIDLHEIFGDEEKRKEIKKSFRTLSEEDVDLDYALDNIEDLLDILDRLFNCEQIPHHVDTEKAVEIFNTINSSGTKLNNGDLAYAMVSVVYPDFKSKFMEFTKKMEKGGYDFSVFFYMRLLAVLMGKSALLNDLDKESKDVNGNVLPKMDEKMVNKAWSSLTRILPKVLKIYAQKLFITSDKEFISASPIYVVSAYLNNMAKNEFNGAKDVSNWMYYTLLAGVHQRYSGSGGDSKIDEDIEYTLKSKEQGRDPVDTLRNAIAGESGSLEVTKRKIKGSKAVISNGVFATYIYMLKHTGAVDWIKNEEFYPKLKLDPPSLHFHHIFPSESENDLEKLGQETLFMDNVPNRAVLTATTNQGFGARKPEDYLKEVVIKHETSLKQQNIPTDADLWKDKNFDDFMDLRSETLSKSLTEFIESFNKLGEFVPVVQAGDWGPEDKKLEYKASYAVDINKTGVPIRELKLEVVQSICSMANTEGGKIIIGVKDDETICGIQPDLDNKAKKSSNPVVALKNDIIKFANSNLSRKGADYKGFSDQIEDIEIDGKIILIITVSKVTNKPPVGVNGKIYRRIGDGDFPIEGDDLLIWSDERFGS